MSPCWSCRDGSSVLWQPCLPSGWRDLLAGDQHSAGEGCVWLHSSPCSRKGIFEGAFPSPRLCVWLDTKTKPNQLGHSPECSHLPTPVPLHWGHCMRECSEEISKLLLTQLLLASGLGSHKGKPVYMAFIHVSASESCWKRARRLQSRRSLVSPLDAGVCVLLKGNGSHWIYFLFSSPLPLWQLLLVSTCGCLLPVTHPKPSLPRTHLHIWVNAHLVFVWYEVFCSLSFHISNHICLLYLISFPSSSSPGDSWLPFWREVAVPNHTALKWVAQMPPRSCALDPSITDPVTANLHQQCSKPAAACVELRLFTTARTFDRWIYNIQAISHR